MSDCDEVISLLYAAMKLKENEALPEESKLHIRLHLKSCTECSILVEEESPAELILQPI